MTYYIQLNNDNKVISYSSSRVSNNDIEIKIDSNTNYKELLINPFIFKFDDNAFIKDIEYQNKLIKEKQNRLTDDKKINKLTKELAKTKVESMQKDAMISMLIREQAKTKIEKMKVGA